MKIYKNINIDEPHLIDEVSFNHTRLCLSNVNWNRTRDCNNHLEYHGYSNSNMIKAINSKHPMIYSHYNISFSSKDNSAYLQNNKSSSWIIKFNSKQECKNFKKEIFKKFFNTINQLKHKHN